jgi:DNA-binding MurR/RpiR family transcriptional regulator
VSGGVLERIRALMPQMPEVQRMLAGIVAADPAAASRMTIVELAELGQVSTGSITRLCRALGLSGYSELRLALASDSARTEPYSLAAHIGADVAPGDDIQQIAKVILANVSRAVTDSVNHVNLLDIERAAAKLTAARRVEIFGVGGSGVMAADLQQRLYRIGIPCWAWSDTHVALTGAALLGANDVVVVISHSGRTREVHDLVTEAASHGAFTIAVTDERRSPAAGNADLVLSTSVGDLGYRTEAIVARHAQLAVLDLLYVAMAQRTFEQTRDAIAVTAHAVSAYKEKPRKK